MTILVSRILVRMVALLLTGAMAGSATAQVSDSATADELTKIKQEAQLRKEAYEALSSAEAARKAWQAAQDTSRQSLADQVTSAKAAKEVADAAKAKADAEKAQAEAALAATKARIGDIPAAGYSGAVEAGAGAGQAEGMLLGAKSVNALSKDFATKIKASAPRATRFLLFTSAGVPDFRALTTFDAQFAAMEDAMKRAPGAKGQVKDASAPGVKTESVGTIGLGLDAINKILAFAKTDYKFIGFDVTSTDAMLLSALAGDLGAAGVKVELPDVYLESALSRDNPALLRTMKVLEWSTEARSQALAFEAIQAELEKKVAANPKDEDARALLAQVRNAGAAWKTIGAALDGWIRQTTGADDKGNVPFAAIAKQAAIRDALRGGAAMVIVQLHKVAGTAYTKKNLWSSLGANPFFVMGGAVAGYVAIDGQTGKTLSAGLTPWHGGYHSVSDIEGKVNAK